MSLKALVRYFFFLLSLVLLAAAGFSVWERAQHALAQDDAKRRLGGDVEIIQGGEPIPMDASAFLLFSSERISRTVEIAATASYKNLNLLVGLKGIDAAYPLYGELLLSTDKKKIPVFFNSRAHNLHGAAIDRRTSKALGLNLGETFSIEGVDFMVRALILDAPDEPVQSIALLPRVIVNNSAFYATGLASGESRAVFRCGARLEEGVSLADIRDGAMELFPAPSWRMRSWPALRKE